MTQNKDYAKKDYETAETISQTALSTSAFQFIPVSKILFADGQSRKTFNNEAIQRLVDSIRENGVLQPVIVKKISDSEYRLEAGEMRLCAAKACGLIEVPAVLKDDSSESFLEWALFEIIRCGGLSPIEEAETYQHLLNVCALSLKDIARRVGKNHYEIENRLKLLTLKHWRQRKKRKKSTRNSI